MGFFDDVKLSILKLILGAKVVLFYKMDRISSEKVADIF